MENLFKHEEFALFIINHYLKDEDLSDIEKLQMIGDDIEKFAEALREFKAIGNKA